MSKKPKQAKATKRERAAEAILAADRKMQFPRKTPPLDEQLARIREAVNAWAPSSKQAEEFMDHIRYWVVIHDDYVHSPESRSAADKDAVRLHRLSGDLAQVPKLLRKIDEARKASRDLRDVLQRVGNDVGDLGLVGYIHLSQQKSFDSEAFSFWGIAHESVVLPSATAAAKTIRDPRQSRPLREPSLALLVGAVAVAAESHLGIKPVRSPNSRFIQLLQAILQATGREKCSRSTCRDIVDGIFPNLRQQKEKHSSR